MNQNLADNLIIKLLENTISKEESSALVQWLNNKENLDYFNDFVEINYLLNAKQEFDYKNSLEKVKKRLHKKPKKIRPTFFKYAAAVILLLTSSYFLLKNDNVTVSDTEIQNNIKPGYQKATLVLSNGKAIDLEAFENQVIVNNNITKIQNTNAGLVYNSTDAVDNGDITPEFNTLIVPIGGVYQVTLPDGTKVWLNSKTSLKYPEKFTSKNRLVQLEGEAYFEVTKNTKEFIVQTNTASITVLGTHFNVSSYPDDTYMSSTLVEGKIELASLKSKNKVVLEPQQRAVLKEDNPTINVNTVDTSVFTSWREGKFYFQREKLGHILAKVSRWYDVDIVFEDEKLKDKIFTGVVFKDKSISYLLKMISKTTKVNYKITKNKKTEKYEIKITKN